MWSGVKFSYICLWIIASLTTSQNWKNKNKIPAWKASFLVVSKDYKYIKVIRQVRRLGGKNGEFRHNKASNA
jgi:hypothetical protein